MVYIDRLASGHYGGEDGKNHENFVRALRELGGNPLFAMLHPKHLLEKTGPYHPAAVPHIQSIVGRQPNTLLDETAVVQAIAISSLDASTKQKLTDNLWRASIASICYLRVRVPEVHGPGSIGVSFDETIYMGQKGFKVEFSNLYAALCNVHKKIMASSIKKECWFDNPDYPKRNSAI